MKLYKLSDGIVLQHNNANYLIQYDWDALINREGLYEYLFGMIAGLPGPHTTITVGASPWSPHHAVRPLPPRRRIAACRRPCARCRLGRRGATGR